MNNNNGIASCTGRCVLAAALIGLLTAILLGFLGGWSFFSAVFAGIVVGVIAGLLLNWILCRSQPEISEGQVADTGVKANATSAQTATADATASSTTAAPSKPEKEASAETVVKPSTALAGEAELASRKGTWTYKGDADSQAPAEKAPAKKAPAKKAAAKKAPAKKSPTKKAPAKAAKAKSEKAKGPTAKAAEPKSAADTGAGKKPEALSAAREGGPDNLKQIKGVGPKMETLLHSMGFFHFDQVAGWGADEVSWVDQNLQGFKGRATRDEWVTQAKILAEGGTTEFSSKVKKGGVY